MVTKDMLISDALKEGDPNTIAEVLYSFGMHCLGCALAHGETLEQAAEVHGVDVDAMVAAINEAIAK